MPSLTKDVSPVWFLRRGDVSGAVVYSATINGDQFEARADGPGFHAADW